MYACANIREWGGMLARNCKCGFRICLESELKPIKASLNCKGLLLSGIEWTKPRILLV